MAVFIQEPVHRSFSYNNPKLETTQVFFNE